MTFDKKDEIMTTQPQPPSGGTGASNSSHSPSSSASSPTPPASRSRFSSVVDISSRTTLPVPVRSLCGCSLAGARLVQMNDRGQRSQTDVITCRCCSASNCCDNKIYRCESVDEENLTLQSTQLETSLLQEVGFCCYCMATNLVHDEQQCTKIKHHRLTHMRISFESVTHTCKLITSVTSTGICMTVFCVGIICGKD